MVSHKEKSLSADDDFRALIYKVVHTTDGMLTQQVLTHYSESIEMFYKTEWDSLTRDMSLERKRNVRRKADKMIWRLENRIHSMLREDCLNPGIIMTPLIEESVVSAGDNFPLGHLAIQRKGEAVEAAYLIGFLLSDASAYISGTCQSIDGGWNC